MIEELLQLLIGEVDAKLLKTVVLLRSIQTVWQRLRSISGVGSL
jgi:hypothetical protein